MSSAFLRNGAKLIFFILIFFGVGKFLGEPYIYISHNLASWLAHFLSGDVNAESLYDAYFYIDVASVTIITITIYSVSLFIFRKLWFKPPH